MKRTIVIPLLLAFGLLAAACSSGTADSGVASLESGSAETQSSDTTVAAGSEEDAVLAFTACLRDEGLDVEDPTVDADGNLRPPRPRDVANLDREQARTAFDACSDYLQDVTFGFDGADQTERQDQLLEYAVCMRDNGYDMPDPDLTRSGTPGQGGGGPFGELDLNDPAFQSAQTACSDIFGGTGPIPGGGTGQG